MRGNARALPLALALALLTWREGAAQKTTPVPVPTYSYTIVNRYPHDTKAFTQGLIYRDGFLFESTGLNGQSSVRKVRLETGDVIEQRNVDKRFFAEGLTEFGGELFQLTWESGTGFVYDAATFLPKRRFSYHGEGWGLTHDGSRLIVSDGTPALRFFDPTTFTETGRVRVFDNGRTVDKLNELEFIKGQIYANIWLTDRIAIIDPVSGHVTAWLDLAGLGPNTSRKPNAVLNGIAYDAAADRLFVTGKLWPTLFEIRIRQ
jgi:glutamine cyclotransferase